MEYAGFWIRVAATLIDSLLIILITVPLLYGIYGEHYFNRDLFITGLRDFLISWVLPALAAVMFWIYLSATPGKVILHLKIIAAGSSGHPFPRQFVIRYLAYFIASIPLGAGLLRGAFDVRKQGRHDKLANTVVIRER
ncbi:MAG: hypothetical protein AUJ57_03040 [Zetaproteobacteria bacterium CG1_02_53_45]|nr:MAG: hypothetical protein AUJ57_03040 [Zetaproteobacteria bacterium CG1_02_53_45]